MQIRLRGRWWCVWPMMAFYLVCCGFVSGAAAQFVLKPNGQNAAPLRLKTMSARATIRSAQFAVTDLDLTFQNELDQQTEADFYYTVPDRAVVTDFAYYFAKERVVARVVEKERAATIYRRITTQNRDPALIEMVGKNRFRARIFPVEANADLRVQVRYVQAMAVTKTNKGGSVRYVLPLKATSRARLEKIAVSVRLVGTPDGVSIANNFGLPVVGANGGDNRQIAFDGRNYRAGKDLSVSLILPSSEPLHANLYAARSGGTRGFFALTLAAPTTGEPLIASSVRLRGVVANSIETIPLGKGLLVSGRYSTSADVSVRPTVRTRGGRMLTATRAVRFGTVAEPNNLASKLWANARIARLSVPKDDRNRDAVVGLSLRYALVSKYTSWLAIPKAERKRFEAEMNEANAESISDQLLTLRLSNRERSAEADTLRKRFVVVLRRIKGRFLSDISTLENYQENSAFRATNSVAQNVVDNIATGKSQTTAGKRERQMFAQLCKITGDSEAETLRWPLQQARSERVQRIVQNIADGKEKTLENRRLQQQLTVLSQAIGDQVTKRVLSVHMSMAAREYARQWALNKNGSEPQYGIPPQSPRATLSQVELEKLKRKVRQLARANELMQEDVSAILEEAQNPWRTERLQHLRDQIVKAREKKENIEKIRRMEMQFADLVLANFGRFTPTNFYRRGANYDEESDTVTGYWRDKNKMTSLYNESYVVREVLKGATDAVPKKKLVAHQQAASKAATDIDARVGDPLLSVRAPKDALAVVARMPSGDLLPLVWNEAAKMWQARFDIPTYFPEKVYVVRVAVRLRTGELQTRVFRFRVDMTAPTITTATAQRTANSIVAPLRLTLIADTNSARAHAILPDRRVVSLLADEARPGRFFALVPNVSFGNGRSEATVRFVVTDRAHNRAVRDVRIGP